jgi:hypothetical protein
MRNKKRVSMKSDRHEANCKICTHSKRDAIDQEWIDWGNTKRIAKAYGVSRDSIYRHAHARGLFPKRRGNLRRALEHIIEHAEIVQVNASAVVAAIQALAKINGEGRWVERPDQISLNELFEQMTGIELEAYAKDGTLPRRILRQKGATPPESD